MTNRELLEEAKKARLKSYAPYSKFQVGERYWQKTEQFIMAVI